MRTQKRVLPFFRASVVLKGEQRAVFDPVLDSDQFLQCLKRTPDPFRHNLQRMLVAAEIAHRQQADLVLAEGWKSNRLEESFCTGAEVGARLVLLLQERGLTPFAGAIHRLDISRCTWEEVFSVHRVFPDAQLIGVTSSPNPSAARARSIMKQILPPGSFEVHSDTELSAEQRKVFLYCQVPIERRKEAINWAVHAVSEVDRVIRKPSAPLEMKWAVRLRRDGSL